jgi:hypothetical protein
VQVTDGALNIKMLVLTAVRVLRLSREAGNRYGDAECYREDRTKDYSKDVRLKHDFLL